MELDLLLINTPTDDYSRIPRKDYYTLPPLGLGSIATVCEKGGFRVSLLDAERLGLTPEEIIQEVKRLEPGFVGLNPLPSNYTLVRNLARGIWTSSHARIILGGPFCTIRTRQMLQDNRFVFAAIKGEGELPVLQLLRGRSRRHVPGVAFRDNGRVFLPSTTSRVANLDALPRTNRRFFVDDPCETNGQTESIVITSRGCPYRCTYCGASQVAGQSVRFRSVTNVVEEIQHLCQGFDVSSIYFIDDLLFLDPRRLGLIAEEIVKRGLRISWRGLARADVLVRQFDDAAMRLIADSGCTQIAFGIESGTARIQKAIRKHLDLELVRKAITQCSRFGISTKGYFMLGFPGETRSEMLETVEFARTCGLGTAFFFGVRAFPGTEMYESLLAGGRTTEELDRYLQLADLGIDPHTRKRLQAAGIDPNSLVKYNVLNRNPIAVVSNEELVELLREAYRSFYAFDLRTHEG